MYERPQGWPAYWPGPGWFVSQNNVAWLKKHPGNGDPLLFAAAKLVDFFVQIGRDVVLKKLKKQSIP